MCENTENNVKLLTWSNINVVTKKGKTIIDNIGGCARQHEALAIMGPSGCGKTTLLNCLAQRHTANFTGEVRVDGTRITASVAKKITAYVQQEDALIGALTVRETITFSAKLLLNTSRSDVNKRVEALIDAFGLTGQADTLVGTPIRKGISGGQKRRVSVASQLITMPKIVFLDEPTSGLDSLSAYEVVLLIRNFARTHGTIVVASIHQPSTTIFKLFDNLFLLSQGAIVYHGTVEITDYFNRAGHPLPAQYNPADFILEITNTDFSHNDETLPHLLSFWESSTEADKLLLIISTAQDDAMSAYAVYRPSMFTQTHILLHRLLIKSYRDIIVYGVRFAMYVGLALLMGTVWLRLKTEQQYIQIYLNAMFFSSAFLSFMAVAYIPAFLEDYAALVQDRANGMYGVTAFLVSNALIGIPFLFTIALTFSLITYWLIHLNPSAPAFFRYLLFIFLDLIAAESLVVLVSSLVPIFVASLAITAFANGLFMSAGGFLVNPSVLNKFYYYFFYQFDYQRYAFEGLATNEFIGRAYECGPNCTCIYQASPENKCETLGYDVVNALGYSNVRTGVWASILIAIAIAMRLMTEAALYLKLR